MDKRHMDRKAARTPTRQPSIIVSNSARALFHSRCTLRSEIPSASAISAAVMPPKKRISTNCAKDRSSLARSSIASLTASTSMLLLIPRIECDEIEIAATTQRALFVNCIDHNASQGARCVGQKLQAIYKMTLRTRRQLHVTDMCQRRGLHRAGQPAAI